MVTSLEKKPIEDVMGEYLYGVPSDDLIRKRSSFYIEVVNDFLLLYARNELGSSATVNLPILAIYLNSTKFALGDGKNIRSRDQIFSAFTDMVIDGQPIWRLLSLDSGTKKCLENQYVEILRERKILAEQERLCLRCMFYRYATCSLGVAQTCYNWKNRSVAYLKKNPSCHMISSIIENKENLNNQPKIIRCSGFIDYHSIKAREISDLDKNSSLHKNLKGLPLEMFDGFPISKEDSEYEMYGLYQEEDHLLEDLGRAMDNSLSIHEEQDLITKMRCVQILYENLNIYCEAEMGSYHASLSKIISFIDRNRYKIAKSSSVEDFVEDLIISSKVGSLIVRDKA